MLEPRTASSRSASFVESGRIDTDEDPNGRKVPSLVHVNHQARSVCLPIYHICLQVLGCDNLWETYLLAEHDIPAIGFSGLRQLLDSCNPGAVWLDKYHAPKGLNDHEVRVWYNLCDLGFVGKLDSGDFANLDQSAPRIKALLNHYLTPIPFPGLRGNLESVSRLIVFRDHVQHKWPGLYHDMEVLENLERAFPVLADCDNFTGLEGYAHRFPGACVAELPERYRCRRLDSPDSKDLCDSKQPVIAISWTAFGLGMWLKAAAVEEHRTPFRGPRVSALGRNDMALWHFSAPVVPEDGLGGSAEADRDTELYAAAVDAIYTGPSIRLVPVYPSHRAPGVCKWRCRPDVPLYERGVEGE